MRYLSSENSIISQFRNDSKTTFKWYMDYNYVIENSFYVDSNYRICLVALRVDIGLFLFIIGKKTCYLAEYKAIYLRKIPSYGVWSAGNILQVIL